MTRPLEMRINLHALEHLGMKLYSTIPPVLSEVVANAWDADAERVDVCIDKEAGEISIQDDGTGMTRNEVIDRFLTVGFQRRAKAPKTPKRKRSPMGRKGIGKLSSFSIARIVTVYTAQDDHRTAFRMDSEKMKEQMERGENDVYKPEELPEELKNIENWPGDPNSGTRIVLSVLKHKVTQWTKKGLRQRIARRFSVIGPERNFIVTVDGEKIETKDRGYYEHVEYLWTYGDPKKTLSSFKNLAKNSEDRKNPEDRKAEIAKVKGGSDLSFSGWIGTVKTPSFLKAEDGENLNRLAVFMRGKLAQEDILTEFAQKELYAAYVVGEIHCDNLDRDDDEDIATSSRQSLKHDDPRFGTVRDIVRKELRYIAGRWSDLRRRDGAKTFAREVPVVKEWLDALKGDTKKKAERWIGRLNVIRFGDSKKDDLFKKRELLKASILAFESYLRREQLDFLEKMDDYNIKTILDVFNDLDGLERSYYGQIVKLRLGAIKTLEEKLNDNEKEQAIRDCIFRHLWLLDPSWERVEGSEVEEKTITKFLKGPTARLTKEEQRARIDIGYRTAQGRHVIVELKRPNISIKVGKLVEQIRKYRKVAQEQIAMTDFPKWPLDIICLVGKPPPEWKDAGGEEDVKRALESVDARLLFYKQLLERSRRAYHDYLEKYKKIDRLSKIFERIDNFARDADE